jgi:DNA-binding XRE family transcriptional regulator
MTFSMDRFRAHLRAARDAHGFGRDALAEKIGIAKTTIQNAEVGPDMPGIETVARIIEGLPGYSLSAFFRQLEMAEPPVARSDQAPEERVGERPLPPYPSDEEIARRVIRTLAGWAQPENPESPTPDREPAPAARAGETEHDLHHRRRARRPPRQPKTRRRAR